MPIAGPSGTDRRSHGIAPHCKLHVSAVVQSENAQTANCYPRKLRPQSPFPFNASAGHGLLRITPCSRSLFSCVSVYILPPTCNTHSFTCKLQKCPMVKNVLRLAPQAARTGRTLDTRKGRQHKTATTQGGWGPANNASLDGRFSLTAPSRADGRESRGHISVEGQTPQQV